MNLWRLWKRLNFWRTFWRTFIFLVLAMPTKSLTKSAYDGTSDGSWKDQPHTTFTRKAGKSYWRYRVNKNGIKINTTRGKGRSLQEDRAQWSEWNVMVEQGINPLKRGGKSSSFEAVAERYLDRKIDELTSKVSVNGYINTIRHIAIKEWGARSIDSISRDDVIELLSKDWRKGGRVETMNRLRARLEQIFSLAIADGFRSPPNPATWKDNLEHYLSSPEKLKDPKNIAAMNYLDAPKFYKQVREGESISHKCLEFYMLTVGGRIGGTRQIQWEDIDIPRAEWVCPKATHKSRNDWSTPLLPRAIEILEEIRIVYPEKQYIFGSPLRHKNVPVSNTAITKVHDRFAPIEPKTGKQADVHGWRATFKTWAEEVAVDTSSRVIEVQSGRSFTSSAAEAAYMRGDLYAKRFDLLSQWYAFLND